MMTPSCSPPTLDLDGSSRGLGPAQPDVNECRASGQVSQKSFGEEARHSPFDEGKGASAPAAAPDEVGLDTSANNASASGRERRSIRYTRRSIAQQFTDHKRLCDCGRAAFGDGVTLRLSNGIAGVAGVMTCGSVWVCSVCSAKIAHRRQLELRSALVAAASAGYPVALLTLTMRHKKADPLVGLWDDLAAAWRSLTSGRGYQGIRSRFGILGYARVTELTHGRHGWHVHLHVLLFLEPATDTGEPISALRDALLTRWESALARRGASSTRTAQDLRLVSDGSEFLAEYLTKSTDWGDSVAREIAWGQAKHARSVGGRTPFQLLDSLIATGDAEDLLLWQEYASASTGRRQLTWSRGIRDLLNLGQESTDEEIADEELEDETADVIRISSSDWWSLSARGEVIAALLDALELHGALYVRDMLWDMGVRADLVGPPGGSS